MNTSQFIGIPGMMFPDQEILAFEGKRVTYGELVDRIKRLERNQGLVKPAQKSGQTEHRGDAQIHQEALA